MQSRRCRLPVVEDLVAFASLASRPAVALAERDGRPPSLGALVLVGPEGGWTAAERATVDQHLAFGPQVLRAETAAMAVAAVLGSLRAGLVAPAVPSPRT